MSEYFGMDQYGMDETVVWSEKFAAWHLTFAKEGWTYERLLEHHPRTMSEQIKKFYSDDAVYALSKDTP
jgi:hypothetical protein